MLDPTFSRKWSAKDQSSLKFRKNNFVLPDLEYINGAGYWNYQRSKIYVRTRQRPKRLTLATASSSPLRLPLNKISVDSLGPMKNGGSGSVVEDNGEWHFTG